MKKEKEANTVGQETKKNDVPKTRHQTQLKVLKSINYNNLQIFPIVGKAEIIDKVYVTLEKALDKNFVTIKETQEVNNLTIHNNSSAYIFIQAGDIVKGGMQDRTIKYDLIIAPKAKNIGLSSFCVESGRWSSRQDEDVSAFKSSKQRVSNRDIKYSASVQGSQSEVWSSIQEEQYNLSDSISAFIKDNKFSIEDSKSTSSYQLSLENEDLGKINLEYFKELKEILKIENLLGMAYAINGEVFGIDIFNNQKLFNDLSKKLFNAYIIEAISENRKDKKGDLINPEELNDLLDIHLNKYPDNASSTLINSDTCFKTQQFQNFTRLETTDVKKEKWLHINYIVGVKSKANFSFGDYFKNHPF